MKEDNNLNTAPWTLLTRQILRCAYSIYTIQALFLSPEEKEPPGVKAKKNLQKQNKKNPACFFIFFFSKPMKMFRRQT